MLEPADRRYIKGILDGLRTNYRSFAIAWPLDIVTCPDCGFDEFTQSGLNVNCLTCNGTGRVYTWCTVEVYGRLQHYDFVTLAAAGVPPGIEVGDVVLYVSTDTKDIVLDCKERTEGYVYVDGDTYRPFSTAPTGVGSADEWRIELKRTEMDARAPGY